MDLLRSTLQPLTHNLPAPITTLGTNLLGAHCYKTLILDIDPLISPPCLKLFISKALGVGIISFSSIVKIPQILKLLTSRSATGVSFLSYFLETCGFVASLAYNARQGFPFSTYGETALIAVQNAVICVLVLHFRGRDGVAGGFVAGLGAGLWALMREEVVGGRELGYVQAVAGNLGVASKVPQIWTVWREGGTGQLSAFAVSFSNPSFRGTLGERGLRRGEDGGLSCENANGLFSTGFQLSTWIAGEGLHDIAGGGRQADLIWLPCGLRAQCCSGGTDGILLEESCNCQPCCRDWQRAGEDCNGIQYGGFDQAEGTYD